MQYLRCRVEFAVLAVALAHRWHMLMEEPPRGPWELGRKRRTKLARLLLGRAVAQ